jgi:hypothetical protein
MPDWFPISRFGALLAALYAIGAILVVAGERTPGGGGGWISLAGMASYLATIPVSLPFEMLGQKLDYRRNLDMGFAILVCSALVYLVGAGFAWIIGQIVHGSRS